MVEFPHWPFGDTIKVPVGAGGWVEVVEVFEDVVVVDTEVDVDVVVETEVDDDVDVDMEWVPQPLISDAIPVTQLDEALPVKGDNRADSLETAEGQGSVGAVLQAVTGGMEGISDAIKVGQAGSV